MYSNFCSAIYQGSSNRGISCRLKRGAVVFRFTMVGEKRDWGPGTKSQENYPGNVIFEHRYLPFIDAVN